MTNSDEILDLPGLGPVRAMRALSERLEIELPPQATGRGLVSLSQTRPKPPAQNVVSAIIGVATHAASVEPRRSLVSSEGAVDRLARDLGLSHLRLFVRDDAPGVLEIETAGTIHSAGELELERLDDGARARVALEEGGRVSVECPALATSPSLRRFLVLEPRGGQLQVHAVEVEEEAPSEAFGRAMAGKLGPLVRIEAPEWARLLKELPAAPWLRARMERTERTAGDIGHLVAIGLVLRLFEPHLPRADRLTRAREVGALRDELREYVRALPVDAIERALREALAGLGALFEEVSALRTRVEGGAIAPEEPGAEAVRALLDVRDDLESALRALEARGAGRGLAEELVAVDSVIATLHTLLSEYVFPDDPHLEAVALQEPESWWGAHAGLHR